MKLLSFTFERYLFKNLLDLHEIPNIIFFALRKAKLDRPAQLQFFFTNTYIDKIVV